MYLERKQKYCTQLRHEIIIRKERNAKRDLQPLSLTNRQISRKVTHWDLQKEEIGKCRQMLDGLDMYTFQEHKQEKNAHAAKANKQIGEDVTLKEEREILHLDNHRKEMPMS